MRDIKSIINKLPDVIDIFIILVRLVTPKTGKQFWALEREIYKLTNRIGDQFVLKALKKAHHDQDFINDVIGKARLDRPCRLEIKAGARSGAVDGRDKRHPEDTLFS